MKTFILGVGAQKCGTTWLYDQFKANKSVDMGFRKEYHVFDSIENPKQHNGFREKYIQNALDLHHKRRLGKNLSKKMKGCAKHSLMLAFIDNIDNYFNYFDYIYLKNDQTNAVGDITPNYANLKPKTFKLLKNGLEKRGFNIKVFFLMRDPVERLWSSARMKKRKMKETEKDSFDEFDFLTSCKQGNEQDLKTRYELTINNLEEVFHPADIYYGFYEELFSDISYQKIEHFLGIQLQPFNAAHIANASPKQLPLPKQLNLEIAERYRQTYNFIRNRHGNSMLNLWQGYQLL